MYLLAPLVEIVVIIIRCYSISVFSFINPSSGKVAFENGKMARFHVTGPIFVPCFREKECY